MMNTSRLTFSEVRANELVGPATKPAPRGAGAAGASRAPHGAAAPDRPSNESLASDGTQYGADGFSASSFIPTFESLLSGRMSSVAASDPGLSAPGAGAALLTTADLGPSCMGPDTAETNVSASAGDLAVSGALSSCSGHAAATSGQRGGAAGGGGRGGGGAAPAHHRHARTSGYRRMWAAVCAPRSSDGGGGGHGAGGAGNNWRDVSVEDLIRAVQALPPSAPAADAVRSGLAFLDSRAYAALLKGLAKAGLAHRAAELFDETRRLEPNHELAHLADIYTYTTAISQCSSHHQLRRALELVAEMRARSVALNVHTYSALLNVCLKCNELDLALDIYGQMLSEGCTPNLVTFNTLLDVYAKTGHWAEALGVLDQLDAQGIAPEPRTYNTVVAACNMSGHYTEALQVYDRMLTKGIEPMPATYNAAVCALARLGRLPAALSLLATISSRGVERGVTTYAALLSACEALGRWDVALDLLARMQEEGLKPTTACFNSAIGACVTGGQPHRAEHLFEVLCGVCKPDAASFNALVRVYCQLGKPREAMGMLEMMARSGQHVEPSTYASVIEAAWATGVAPLQAYAARLHERASARHGLPAASALDDATAGVTRLTLPALPPYVALISLVRLLRVLRAQLMGSGGGVLAVRPAVRLTVAAQDDNLLVTEQVVLGVLCALGCPLQPLPSTATSPVVGPQRSITSFRTPSPASGPLMGVAGPTSDECLLESPASGMSLPHRPSGAASATEPSPAATPPPGTAASDGAAGQPETALTPPPPAALALACDGAAFTDWLSNPIVGAALSAMLPEDAPSASSFSGPLQGPGGSPPGSHLGLVSGAAGSGGGGGGAAPADGQLLAQEDAVREARCRMAMAAVQRIEAAAAVDVNALPADYLLNRSALAALVISAAPLLGLPPEVGHDAALLLDRAATTTAPLSPLLGGGGWDVDAPPARAAAAAALALCAPAGVPPDAAMCEALLGASPPAVAAAAAALRAALGGGAAAAVSPARVLRLYAERLGARSSGGSGPPARQLVGRAPDAAAAAAASHAFLGIPPSLTAMALLFAGRLAAGLLPSWPTALQELTGYTCGAGDELVAPLVRQALELVLISE